MTAFIGPSGCGKSTVLRTLNRMHEVIPKAYVEGKVLLDGDDLYGPGVDPVRVRRQVGMVFQRPNPFPTMSIGDNVLAGVRLNHQRLSGTKAKELLEQSLRGRQPVERGRRTGWTAPAPVCPVVSSSGSASPGPSPCSPRSS